MADAPIEVPITHLRKQLQAATSDRNFHEHGSRVAAIDGHSIREVPLNDPRRPNLPEYNCFAFALDLAGSSAFRLITGSFSHLEAGSGFVHYLISRELITATQPQSASERDVVIYFEGEEAKHGACMFQGRLVSKWGEGLLWDHILEEVPAQYGTFANTFRQLGRKAAECAFLAYIREEENIELERLPAWSFFVEGPGRNV